MDFRDATRNVRLIASSAGQKGEGDEVWYLFCWSACDGEGRGLKFDSSGMRLEIEIRYLTFRLGNIAEWWSWRWNWHWHCGCGGIRRGKR
jgi:hypothetical protein